MTSSEPTSRRRVLKGAGSLAGAGAVGGLAGCLEDDPDDTDDTVTDDTDTDDTDTDDEQELADSLSWWAVDTARPPSGWDQWEAEHDFEIDHTPAPWRQGEVMNRIVVGGGDTDFDYIQNDVTLTGTLAGEDVIHQPDWEEIDHWDEAYQEVNETFGADLFGHADGELMSIIPLQNGDSVVCLEDHVGGPEENDSYGILFDDEFAGRTALEAGFSMPLPKTMQYLAYNDLADIEPDEINRPDQESVDAAIEFIEEQRDEGQFRTFWSGWESAVSLLATEEVWAMDTWEPVVFALRADGHDAFYLEPHEGYAAWGHSCWMTTAGTEKRRNFRQFLSWMFDGWYGADVTSATGYLPPTPRGIEYAEESEDYDAEAIESVHEDVLENRLRHENSSFSDNFPGAELFGYISSEWDRITS